MQTRTRGRQQGLMLRAALWGLGCVASMATGCTNDDIVVNVAGLDPDVKTLQVSVTVGGQPLGKPQTVSRTLSQFVMNLPMDQGGTIGLSLIGQVSPDCKLSEGSAQFSFSPGGLKPTTVQVQMKTLPALLCSLPGVDLRAIWGSSPQDVWAVGANTAMLHWDDSGNGWTRVPATVSTYNDIWGSGPNDVYAVAQFGAVEHWNGSTWSRMTLPAAAELHGVFGFGPTAVWFVGDNGAAVRWNGTSATATTTGVSSRLTSIWGAASNDIWAVGLAGVVLRWTGSSWARTQPSPTAGQSIHGLSGSGVADVWGFGINGVLPHFNGTAWLDGGDGLPMVASGNDLWAASFSEVWGAASSANVVRWDGTRWDRVPIPSGITGNALKLWGVGNHVWVVIQDGTLLRFKR